MPAAVSPPKGSAEWTSPGHPLEGSAPADCSSSACGLFTTICARSFAHAAAVARSICLPSAQTPQGSNRTPTCPGNLRPISVLPAVSKILARIAAQRIRPLLEQALASQPQYAYLIARRTTDALDRVYDHCEQARQQVASVRPDPFVHSKRRSSSLRGGLQLSLDLSRAFDKLPRSKLSQALHRIRAPPDLIQLILYLHQEMILVFRRGDLTTELLTGAGIRQGCGLAPLIWCAYSLLILEQFETYLHRHQITAFADDLHLNWIITAPMQFRQACIHIGKNS